ncbi:MAG: ABC transporter substrate-binding protein [Chroococcales cyanobacterium]
MNRISLFLKRFKGLGKFIGLFVLCFSLIVACNGDRNAQQVNPVGVESGRVRIGTTLKPRTLDPADTYELSALMLIYNMGDRLYNYQPGTTELQPQLATEMPTISEDGLTYVIPLRSDVVFHDGTPFNAEAMEFSLNRFIQNGGKPSFLLGDIIDTVEATGDYELTIQLKQPFAAFPALLGFTGASAVSPEAYEIGEGNFNPNEFIGTGPYKLTQFSSDSVRLEPFEDYWGEQPANEGVDVQIYASNPANLFNAFRTGEVDVAYQSLDPQQIQTLLEGADNNQWQAVTSPGTVISYMSLNRNQPPLEDKMVRKAIASMVDRELLNQRVLQGQGEPAYSMIPSTFEAYEPVFKEMYGDGNIDQAKELLQEAGYSAQNPVTVDIWYPSGSTTRSLVATTLKAYAEQNLEGAVVFEPRTVESASFFSNISQGIYPTALVDWYPDFLDPDNYIQPFLRCAEGSAEQGCAEGGSVNQGSFYYNERMNELIDQERQTQNPEEREAIFREIQELLAEDVPYIPLWQSKDYAFAKAGINGLIINPGQDVPFWTIEK